ncbi:hypothetical protein ACA910_000520 [Epithemia clementina (nom. ined.)]
MYGLPCSNEQKVRLFQSGLEVSDAEKARRLLLEPGGWRCLLPVSAQQWIFAARQSKRVDGIFMEIVPHDSDTKSSNNSTSSSDVTDLYEIEKDRVKSKSTFVDQVSSLIGVKIDTHEPSALSQIAAKRKVPENDNRCEPVESTANTDPIRISRPTPPLDAFCSVLKEMLMETANQNLAAFADNKMLEIVGGAASVMLLAQLGLSHRSRKIVWSLLTGATTAGLAAVWSASMAAIFVKYNAQLLKMSENHGPILQAYLRKLVRKCRNSRTLQGIMAVLVILLWRKRERVAAVDQR